MITTKDLSSLDRINVQKVEEDENKILHTKDVFPTIFQFGYHV